MIDLSSQIESAVKAVWFYSPTTYSWFGQRSPRLPAHLMAALSPKTAREYLLYSLQCRLYNDFYSPGFAAPSPPDKTSALITTFNPFVRKLSVLNQGKGYRQNGWKVKEVTSEEVIVQQANLSIWVNKKSYTDLQGMVFNNPGSDVSLRFPKENLGISPGFYMALSNVEMVDDKAQVLVRFYWNITPEGALKLMEQITHLFNREKIPFRFKVLNDPQRYNRADSAVLYINKHQFQNVTSILHEIYPQVIPNLKRAIPTFTKLLAPGLGLAEDPGNGESFGMHRCKMLAEGMIRACEQGQQSFADKLKVVKECFMEAGISIDAPYLNPGSRDDYEGQFNLRNEIYAPDQTLNKKSNFPPSLFLQTASEIGQRLAQTAIWYKDKCNWMGFEAAKSRESYSFPNYVASGPDLYAGTSGIALFLGELFTITRNDQFRKTASGAIYHALSHYKTIPPPVRLGFYSGWLGIAYSAIRLGQLMNEEKLIKEGKELLYKTISGKHKKNELDLLSGIAGGIVALTVLYKLLNDALLLDYAVRLGEELIDMAEKSSLGFSWGSNAFPRRPHLTGFSHGAAGIGYSLLELSAVTGHVKFRNAAFKAFSFERHWFDPETQNWPDFRESTRLPNKKRGALSFATFWCHGAPGIALSRLRAFEIYKDPTCHMESIIALKTTQQQIIRWLQAGAGNYSLCHGLAGNAEILIFGNQILGNELTWGSDLAKVVATNGIELYAKADHTWPCGSDAGQTPGLMLGLAGIGFFYLRLHKPSIPAVLLINSNIEV